MKAELRVDRELIEQLLVVVFGPDAQYKSYEPRDADSYTIQVKTKSGNYSFVLANEILLKAQQNRLTQSDINQIRQLLFMTDSDPVVTSPSKKDPEKPSQPIASSEMPKKGLGCLGVVLLLVGWIAIFLINGNG